MEYAEILPVENAFCIGPIISTAQNNEKQGHVPLTCSLNRSKRVEGTDPTVPLRIMWNETTNWERDVWSSDRFERWEGNSNPMRPVALSQGTLKRNTSFETRLLSRHHGNWSHYKKIDISVNQIQLIWNMPNHFKRQQSTCVARLIAQTKDRLYSLLYQLLAVVGWEIFRREVQRKVWLKLKQTRTFVRSKG